jgi:hypothetical protein
LAVTLVTLLGPATIPARADDATSTSGANAANATQTLLSGVAERIGGIETRLDALNLALAREATRADGLRGDLAALNVSMAALESHGAAIPANLTRTQAAVTNLATTLDAIGPEMRTIRENVTRLALTTNELPNMQATLAQNLTGLRGLVSDMEANMTKDHVKLYAMLAVTDPADPDYGRPWAQKVLAGEAALGGNDQNLSLIATNGFGGVAGAVNLSSGVAQKRSDELSALLDHQGARLTWLLVLVCVAIVLAALPSIVLFGPDALARVRAARNRSLPAAGRDTLAEELGLPTDEEVAQAAAQARRPTPPPPGQEGTMAPVRRRLIMMDPDAPREG